MTDPAKNGNGITKLLTFLAGVLTIAGPMTMGILAADGRAGRAEAAADTAKSEAEIVRAELSAYREQTAGRLARLETTQEQNVTSVTALDATLQREMRLLDDKTRAEGQEIDKRLQSEMDLKIMPLADLARAAEARAVQLLPRIVRLETLAEKEPPK